MRARLLPIVVAHVSAEGNQEFLLFMSFKPHVYSFNSTKTRMPQPHRVCPALADHQQGPSSCSVHKAVRVRKHAYVVGSRFGRQGRHATLCRWLSGGTLTEQCAVWGSKLPRRLASGRVHAQSIMPKLTVMAISLVDRDHGGEGGEGGDSAKEKNCLVLSRTRE